MTCDSSYDVKTLENSEMLTMWQQDALTREVKTFHDQLTTTDQSLMKNDAREFSCHDSTAAMYAIMADKQAGCMGLPVVTPLIIKRNIVK